MLHFGSKTASGPTGSQRKLTSGSGVHLHLGNVRNSSTCRRRLMHEHVSTVAPRIRRFRKMFMKLSPEKSQNLYSSGDEYRTSDCQKQGDEEECPISKCEQRVQIARRAFKWKIGKIPQPPSTDA